MKAILQIKERIDKVSRVFEKLGHSVYYILNKTALPRSQNITNTLTVLFSRIKRRKGMPCFYNNFKSFVLVEFGTNLFSREDKIIIKLTKNFMA